MGDISRGGNGEESSVRLVMSCDARYVVPLAVTLRSLCRWHRESQPVLAYVLFDGVDEAIQRRVTASVGTGIRIHWIPAALEATAGLPIGHHFSRAVFAKITLGTALPADARRVVYLDADILVRRPIDPLFRVDLGAASVGAVVDTLAGTVAHPGGVKAWRTVGLDGRTRMVNAGVLVVDLDRWRAANLDRRLIECAQRIGADLRWGDQDAINVVLSTEIAELPLTWNVLHSEAARASAYSLFPSAEVDDAFQNPAILHFATGQKPWTRGWNRKHLESSAFVREWWDTAREMDILDLLPPKRSWSSWLTGAQIRTRMAWKVFTNGSRAFDP